jgi:hypothetical protein
MGREGAISFLKAAFPVKFPRIKIIATSETKNTLQGYDEITSKILTACSAVISCLLAHFYNYSLYTGNCLDHL